LAASLAATNVHALQGREVIPLYKNRIAYIETKGVSFGGDVDIDHGSGFFIGDRFILTNNHLFPEDGDYAKFEITVRLASKKEAGMSAVATWRRKDLDLAILEIPPPQIAPTTGCPIIMADTDDAVLQGTRIWVAGFPLDYDITLLDGIVSVKEATRWTMTAAINVGNSGGPVFTEDGLFAGIATEGVTQFVTPTHVYPVSSFNYIIPAPIIVKEALTDAIKKFVGPTQCMTLSSMRAAAEFPRGQWIPMNSDQNFGITIPGGSIFRRLDNLDTIITLPPLSLDGPKAIEPDTREPTLVVGTSVIDGSQFEKKDGADGDVTYYLSKQAETGYSIAGCDVKPAVSPQPDAECVISVEGERATLEFTAPKASALATPWVGNFYLTQIAH
jgi:hypothetical protein